MKKSFKEFLTKPGYSEGARSLICHNGIYYKLDRIFELSLDLPVTKMPLSNLQWLIDANTADPERLKNANINVPIIVTPQGGQYVIIDGYHRVVKALQDGEKFIQARIIFDDILAMSRQGSGPSVAFASNVDDQNPYFESVDDINNKLKKAGLKITTETTKQNKWTIYSLDGYYAFRSRDLPDGTTELQKGEFQGHFAKPSWWKRKVGTKEEVLQYLLDYQAKFIKKKKETGKFPLLKQK